MKKISLDISNASIRKDEVESFKGFVDVSAEMLNNKTGLGNEYVGWVDLPVNYDKAEFERVKKAAKLIQEKAEVLIVIGIGGSYLGAKAAIEALTHSFYNDLSKEKRKTPQIYFAGHNISGKYLKQLLEMIEGKDVCLNVISKSGTTTEPAIAFRILKEHVENKYGKEEAKSRIFATTDKARGALRELANQEGYETFIIPDDVGGRFSVLTPVGLLPIAVAGIDIDDMMKGAADGYEEYKSEPFETNTCYQYAVARNVLYNLGKTTEIYVNYEPDLHFISEWLKQLYGESEGKDGKGIFPASVDFSTDLHSMGQYIQDGRRNIFETVINVETLTEDMELTSNEADLDGLNYLSGKTMKYVNDNAKNGTLLAHVDGGVPNMIINIPQMNAFYFGKLIYMFEKACGVSGYLLGVNPFNQPGVEAYKKNMFALLGKPGFEELGKELKSRLEK